MSLLKILAILLQYYQSWSISGYHFLDNQSQDRFIPENGEMTYELPRWYKQLGCCFTVYIDFDRYSSITPLVDFRTDYSKGYDELMFTKPDQIRMYTHYDFKFNGTATNNVQLKWLLICFNIDYDQGTMEMYLNGKVLPGIQRKPMAQPSDADTAPLIVRLGHYYFDDTPLIGKIYDFNLWSRLLTSAEMETFTECKTLYEETPPGDLINKNTDWTISGSLIKPVTISEEAIVCENRTLLLPIRYRTISDALSVCEALGEKGDFLKQFSSFTEWQKFYNHVLDSPAINKYCKHGGRYMIWLPYQGWADIRDPEVNVTFYNTNEMLIMNDAWRKNHPKRSERPFCVVARMGYEVNQSWVGHSCDTWDSVYGWDRAPCSACTLANTVGKNIQFNLRGLCDRTGFDTSYMVMNEENTGLLSYIGAKHTIIKYDQTLYQWNMTVANNPDIVGVSYSDVSSLLIGKHTWHVAGDYACSTKPYQLTLSLSSCNETQFTCSGGVCIDMDSRCDNINDCSDRSDEADCSRVSIDPTYQKFIVPPPVDGKDKTEVKLRLLITQLMDINEVGGYFQVQFYLTLEWYESRLKFKNLKEDTTLNSFLPTEVSEVWVPECIFANTEEKPTTIVDEKTVIFAQKTGGFKVSETYENENIRYYAGTENPLILKRYVKPVKNTIKEILFCRFYNQRFLCNYGLRWYPFDVQKCRLNLEIKRLDSPFIKLIDEDLEYIGERFLTQYEVINVVMGTEMLNGVQMAFVEITLGRELLGVLLNVFIPTIVLGLISYSTNFYKDEYFETVIAINLTTMLVIVTLFVSLSESLPQTAYIKMVDIWLIFNLVIPFALITIHTYMDTHRQGEQDEEDVRRNEVQEDNSRRPRYASQPGGRNDAPNSKLSGKGWSEYELELKMKNDHNSNMSYRAARWLAVAGIPLLSILFIVIYFVAGFMYTNANS